MVFVEGDGVAFSVDFAGGCDEGFFAEFVGDGEYDFGAVDVSFDGVDGFVDDELDADGGGEVEDDVAVLYEDVHGFGVADGVVDELEFWMLEEMLILFHFL